MMRLNKLCTALLAAFAIGASASDFNGNGLIIRKPAVVNSSYDGGLWVQRDAYSLIGGTPGFVNTALSAVTTAGPGLRAYEWTVLGVLNNYAADGENVAGYFQGNAFSSGPTWGSVSEVADTNGSARLSVGTEIDNWTSGYDNGGRVGALIVVGDARAIRGLGGAGIAQATYGILMGATGTTPWAKWTNGIVMGDYTSSGIVLRGNATRQIWVQGSSAVGVDFGDSQTQVPIRLNAGGSVCFDRYSQYCMKEDAEQNIVFTNVDEPYMKLSPGGHLYIKGSLHENALP